MTAELARSARTIHPDEMVRRLFWAPSARIPSATKIATTVRQFAAVCAKRGCGSTTWVAKTTDGKGRNKRKLPEPVAICVRCRHPWDTWDEVNHMATGAPNGGITRRGRWTRFIHVRSQRLHSRVSPEERLFGDADLWELGRLRGIAVTLARSPVWRWHWRVYQPYALHFGTTRGRGGERALALHAAIWWPDAPFPWNRDKVGRLIEGGREEWARRLAAERLIAPGAWWMDSGSTRTESSA